jgi:hypothetical protein
MGGDLICERSQWSDKIRQRIYASLAPPSQGYAGSHKLLGFVDPEFSVIAEKLVPSRARKTDFNVPAHFAKYVPRGQSPSIRLIKMPNHADQIRQQLFGFQHNLVVLGSPTTSDLPRQIEFVPRIFSFT